MNEEIKHRLVEIDRKISELGIEKSELVRQLLTKEHGIKVGDLIAWRVNQNTTAKGIVIDISQTCSSLPKYIVRRIRIDGTAGMEQEVFPFHNPAKLQ